MSWIPRSLYLLGAWILVYSLLQSVIFFVSLFSNDLQLIESIFLSILLSAMIGGGLFFGFRGSPITADARMLVILPILLLVSTAIFSGMPIVFYYADFSFPVIVFEGMAIATSSGISALQDGLREPYALLLWRAIASWISSFGIIIMVLTLFLPFNSGGMQLHNSPLSIGSHGQGLKRVRLVVTALFPLYLALTLACFILLMFSGMVLSNAVLYSFSTLATAGYSIQTTGLIAPLSHPQMVIIGIFLIFAMCNLDVLVGQARLNGTKPVKCLEQRALVPLFIWGISGLILTQIIAGDLLPVVETLFAFVSVVSTTGWYTNEFLTTVRGNEAIGAFLIIFMVIGGGVASTTGGLKILRFGFLYLLGRAELSRLAHPNGIRRFRLGNMRVRQSDIQAIWLLVASFIVFAVIGSLLLSAFGFSFQDSTAISLAALTGAGPAAEIISPYFPGFAGLHGQDYLVISILMMVGRLDITIFMVLFARFFWRR